MPVIYCLCYGDDPSKAFAVDIPSGPFTVAQLRALILSQIPARLPAHCNVTDLRLYRVDGPALSPTDQRLHRVRDACPPPWIEDAFDVSLLNEPLAEVWDVLSEDSYRGKARLDILAELPGDDKPENAKVEADALPPSYTVLERAWRQGARTAVDDQETLPESLSRDQESPAAAEDPLAARIADRDPEMTLHGESGPALIDPNIFKPVPIRSESISQTIMTCSTANTILPTGVSEPSTGTAPPRNGFLPISTRGHGQLPPGKSVQEVEATSTQTHATRCVSLSGLSKKRRVLLAVVLILVAIASTIAVVVTKRSTGPLERSQPSPPLPTAAPTLTRTFHSHNSMVNSVVVSPDGKHLFSGSNDMTIKQWDLSSGALLRAFTGSDWVRTVVVSPDSKNLFSDGNGNTLTQWDIATGALLRNITAHVDLVRTIAIAPEGKHVFSGSHDQTIKQWDVATGALLRTLSAGPERVRTVAISPDSKQLFSGSDTTIKFWDISTGALLRNLTDHTDLVRTVVVSPDGTQLFSGSHDQTIKQWNIATGALLHTFIGHTAWVRTVAVSPDGMYLFSGANDTTIKQWDIRTGALLNSFIADTASVETVALSPDGTQLFSGGNDGIIKQWQR
ncbi:hypothetical protein HDU85_007265 [Gaertneriomyces sp. JEL0708]|nr:hypothetical protein HDU85_007265 [Gaertneriomyces sp. JEL0708]